MCGFKEGTRPPLLGKVPDVSDNFPPAESRRFLQHEPKTQIIIYIYSDAPTPMTDGHPALTHDLDIQITFRLVVLSPFYHRLMEEKLDQAVAERNEAQRKKYGHLFREEELVHIRNMDDRAIFDRFRQTHRHGYVTHLFSLLESSFRDIWKEWSGRDTFDDLGHDLIERLNFCYGQANTNRGKIPSVLILPIQDIVKVRNSIVHYSGHISRSKHKKHLSRLNRPGYSVKDDYIVLEKEFCEWALKSIQDFYTKLTPVFKGPVRRQPSRPGFLMRLLNRLRS